MVLPTPRLGLVISYAYLWHHEAGTGREEGRKDRPCVIVLAVEKTAGDTIVTVVPVTHTPPPDPAIALELPVAVKQHLGLDRKRSWVMLHEGNRFAWPGYDLRPIPGTTGRYDYGYLPPRLFTTLVQRMQQVWQAGRGEVVRRD